MDVLDLDGRVVDEDADGERHPAERHDVERLAQPGEHDDRDEDGKRNGDEDDDRAAPAPEEDEEHERGQPGGDESFLDDALDGCAHEDRLIEQQRDLEVLGKAGEGGRQHLAYTAHHVERARAALLEDAHQDRALAFDVDDVGLGGIPVAHVRYVADIDGRAVHGLDGNGFDLRQQIGARVEDDGVLVGADLRGPRRHDHVLLAEGVVDVARRQSPGEKPLGIDVDHDQALLASVRIGDLDSRDRRHVGADEVDPVVEQLLLAQRLALHRHLQDGDVRGAVADDERRGGAGRHRADRRLGDGGHLRGGGLDLGARLEEDLHHRHAGQRLALDVLDVVDGGGQSPLIVVDHPFLHLLGREARVVEDDGDHRDVDVGEDVRRHPHDGEDPEDDDEHRHHYEGVRALERHADEPHHGSLFIPRNPL